MSIYFIFHKFNYRKCVLISKEDSMYYKNNGQRRMVHALEVLKVQRCSFVSLSLFLLFTFYTPNLKVTWERWTKDSRTNCLVILDWVGHRFGYRIS